MISRAKLRDILQRIRLVGRFVRTGGALPEGAARRVFANSIPKAGTNLLISILTSLPGYRRAWLRTLTDDRGADHRRTLARVPKGTVVAAHAGFKQELADFLCSEGFAAVLMLRDPRSILVSRALYIGQADPDHPLHPRYKYLNHEERVLRSLHGEPTRTEGRMSWPLVDRLEAYRGWLDDARILKLRFENLVGPSGGGSRSAQREAARLLADHLGFVDSPQSVLEAIEDAFGKGSRTFRSGQVEGWRKGLTEDTIEEIEATLAPILGSWGYEPRR